MGPVELCFMLICAGFKNTERKKIQGKMGRQAIHRTPVIPAQVREPQAKATRETRK
jgi:hypothetical protein